MTNWPITIYEVDEADELDKVDEVLHSFTRVKYFMNEQHITVIQCQNKHRKMNSVVFTPR